METKIRKKKIVEKRIVLFALMNVYDTKFWLKNGDTKLLENCNDTELMTWERKKDCYEYMYTCNLFDFMMIKVQSINTVIDGKKYYYRFFPYIERAGGKSWK